MIPFRFLHLKVLSFLLLVLALALTPSIPDIVYRSEITDYFRDDNPNVQAFHKLETDLGFQQSLLVLLEFSDNKALESENISRLFSISQGIRRLSGVTKVNSLLSTAISDNQQNTLSMYRYLNLQQPSSAASATHSIDATLLGQLADNARSNGSLLSEDGRVASLQIHFSNQESIDQLYPQIKSILREQMDQQNAGTTYMLGPVEIKQALHHALLHDGFYLMPFVLVIGMGVLWYFLRSYWLVFSGSVSIVAALWITAGVVGALKLTLNQTSALAFCIAYIIALADIIHLLMSYTHQPSRLSAPSAMLNALSSNRTSLFLTSVTTAIGFLSLNGSSSPVFATFGNIAAIGVACAFISAISITPVVAVLKQTKAREGQADLFQRCILYLNAWRNKLNTQHYVAFYILSILICCGTLLNIFHNDPLDYFQDDSDIITATNVSEQRFHIHHPLSVLIDTHANDGIYSEAFLTSLNAFENWLSAHPDIANHNSFSSTFSQLKRHIHSNNLKWASAPANAQETADLWNLYEMASPDNQPQDLGLDKSFRSAVVSLGIPRLQSQQLIQLEQDIEHWFRINAPQFDVSVTGHALLFASIGKDLTYNMFVGGLLSALVISVLIGVFLGNMKVGILCLVPNLFPAGIVYGLWGASVGIIDIAAAGTLSISLGIVVDDTIHILKRYIDYRKSGFSADASINKTLQQVGSALMLTTLVLSLGMLVLTLSVFGPNQTTAILMASIILVALVYDLIMLPHLLKVFDRWLFPGYQPSQPDAELVQLQ